MGSATESDSRPARAGALTVPAVLVVVLTGRRVPPCPAGPEANVTVKNYSYGQPNLVIDPDTEVGGRSLGATTR